VRTHDATASVSTMIKIGGRERSVKAWHALPIKAVRRDLRQGAKASTPLAPFGSTGVERTGLNVFGVFCGVPAVLVCGDHVVSGS
jgi:hypothetical protein